jgi:DNA polymerase-3 subunit delta'
VRRGRLPASLLLHGVAGTGKERLALWLAQLLLCDAPLTTGEPCGKCQQCRYVQQGAHPDLHWYFPRPRLRDADPDADDVVADIAEAIADRVAADGRWPEPAPTDSIYVAAVRALVARAALTPGLARRKVVVIGNADRMVMQEGSDMAANAFLKLLEEPLADTSIILTTSAVGALLPTIRSRVASVRVAALTETEGKELAARGLARAGANGNARDAAQALIEAAYSSDAERYRAAYRQSSAGARGNFTEVLDAMTELLRDRTRRALDSMNEGAAANAAHAVALVEDARRLTRQNVNPQLIVARLLAHMAEHDG